MRLRGSHDEEEKEKIGGLIVLPKVQTMQGQMNKAKKPGTTHLYHYKEKNIMIQFRKFVLSMIFLFLLVLMSCTISINLVHTEGHASDVVDETDTVDPDISPDITVPVHGI